MTTWFVWWTQAAQAASAPWSGPTIESSPAGQAHVGATLLVVLTASIAALASGAWLARRALPVAAYAALVLACAAICLWMPETLTNTQLDDMHMISSARGFVVDPDANTLRPTAWSEAALALGTQIGGNTYSSAFLTPRFFGVLLPSWAFLWALRWTADRRQALLVGWLAALSPIACAFAASVSAYQPGVVMWVGALAFANGRTRVGVWSRTLSAVIAGALLFLASRMFDEAIFFVLWFLLLQGAEAWQDTGRARFAAIAPGVVVAAVLTALGRATAVRGVIHWRFQDLSIPHVLIYLVVGVTLCNPPFLPLKLAVLPTLWKDHGLRARVLMACGAFYLALYSAATSIANMNQWRYSMMWAQPFDLLLAPSLLAAWDRRTERAARWVIAGAVLSYATGWSYIALRERRPMAQLIASVHDVPSPERSLVLYANHPGDNDTGLLLQAVGGPDYVSVDRLFPPSCPISRDVLRSRSRQEFKDIEFWLGTGSMHFSDLSQLDADVAWVQTMPLTDHFVTTRQQMLDRYHAIPPQDDDACKAGLDTLRARLAGYDHLYVALDGMWWWSARSPIVALTARFAPQRLLHEAEMLDLVAPLVGANDLWRTHRPGLARVPFLRAPVGDGLVWRERP